MGMVILYEFLDFKSRNSQITTILLTSTISEGYLNPSLNLEEGLKHPFIMVKLEVVYLIKRRYWLPKYGNKDLSLR